MAVGTAALPAVPSALWVLLCNLRHCNSRRGGCCRGCGPTPVPDGIEIRAAIPPSKPHTKF